MTNIIKRGAFVKRGRCFPPPGEGIPVIFKARQNNCPPLFGERSHSMRNEGDSVHKNGNSMRNGSVLENGVLLQIAAPARENTRLVPEITRKIIRELCENQPLTLAQIGNLMNRDPAGLRTRFIQEMVREKELIPLHSEPNHPQQAYTTNPDWEKGN